jgi:glycosyltransferase involved in cell wall biosynthesis
MATLLHLTTVHPRTDTRIFIKQAQTLASKLPHKVVLMVADGKGHVEEKQGRVSILDLGRFSGNRLGRALLGSWRAFVAIRKIKPALVHFHDPELIPLGLLLKVIEYKVIYDVHEDVPLQTLGKHYLPWMIRKPLAWIISGVEWFGAKAFNAIVPATPKIAERFPAGKTVTVQNVPISTELLCPTSVPYGKRPQSFAYVGVIATNRGAVEMVRAFESLSGISGAKLDLAGAFSPHGLAETLQELPGWVSVKYHGEVSRMQVAHLLGDARAGLVLFHPSPNHIDAQPNKMFEYMSAGLPVIASDFPLWRRIIDGAGCGLLVDPLNPEAIADAMRWIIDHPVQAEAMGRRSRQAVEDTFNWDAEASKLFSLYKKLLAD